MKENNKPVSSNIDAMLVGASITKGWRGVGMRERESMPVCWWAGARGCMCVCAGYLPHFIHNSLHPQVER